VETKEGTKIIGAKKGESKGTEIFNEKSSGTKILDKTAPVETQPIEVTQGEGDRG
jgi:hypothetical protein